MSSSYLCPMFFFVSVCFFILCFGAIASADDGGEWKEANRAKRQYYDESYYGSYYGQAGRVVGWLLGFLVLMLIICVPCVCCVGIWFLGWFGVRQAMASRRARRREEGPGGGRVMTARDQQEISRRYIESPANAEQRYVYATDRIYAAERRPRTPPVAVHESGGGNAAYASNGVTREVRRL
ncbi:hypothetical protein niasHS_003533 [Heterodera schachtii]|uniref:Uncharacterized protein n=1 Tax=Heterodera schachtii TaxID=97005 RepID=A0ABD2KH91_HETSC